MSAEVANTGKRRGDEVVQLYLQDVVASVTRPVQELKGFKRVTSNPASAGASSSPWARRSSASSIGR